MKIVGKFFAVIFCIIFYFILTGLMMLTFASNIFNSNYYASILEDINLKEIRVSDLGDLINEKEFKGSDTLEIVLVNYLGKANIEESKAKELLNNKKVRKTIGKLLGEIIVYSIGGEKPSMSKDDIKDFFDNDVVIGITGKITDENVDFIYSQIDDIVENAKEGINVSDNETMQLLIKYAGPKMIITYIIGFSIIMYLLISLLTWSFIKPLKYLGIPTLLVGLLLVVIRLASSFILDFVNIDIAVVNNILPIIIKPLLTNGIMCSSIAILMLLLYSLLNKKERNTDEPFNNDDLSNTKEIIN